MSQQGNILVGHARNAGGGGAGTVTTANNGLSLSAPTTAVLGNNINDLLAPAALLSAREIVSNGFSVVFKDQVTPGTLFQNIINANSISIEKLLAAAATPQFFVRNIPAGCSATLAASSVAATDAQLLLIGTKPNVVLGNLTSVFELSGVGALFTITDTAPITVPKLLRINAATGLTTLGETGVIGGSIALAGVTSGLITIQTLAAAGTYTLTLPPNDGNNLDFLQTNGAGVLIWAAGSTVAWNLLGNAASAGNFLGTTNNIPLEIRTNNLIRLTIDDTAIAGKVNILLGNTPGAFIDYGIISANVITMASVSGMDFTCPNAIRMVSNFVECAIFYNGLAGFNTAGAIMGVANVEIGTGTTLRASINYAGNTLKTTPVSGDIDKNNAILRYTNNTAIPAEFSLVQKTRVSTQFDVTNSATLVDVTGLTANVAAGATYKFKLIVYGACDIVAGLQIAFAGTATATAIIYQGVFGEAASPVLNTNRATALATGCPVGSGSTAPYSIFTGTITVNAAGTLTVQMAEEVATPATTASILVGSNFVVEQIQ